MARPRPANRGSERRVRRDGTQRPSCTPADDHPGVGVLNATALVAAIGDGRTFSRGRDLPASLRHVPRQATTDGKPKLLGSPNAAANICASSSSKGCERLCPRCPERRRRSAAGCAACSVVRMATRSLSRCAQAGSLGIGAQRDSVRRRRACGGIDRIDSRRSPGVESRRGSAGVTVTMSRRPALKISIDAGPFMRLGTRGSPSWPGFDPETGYVDADCSDQIAETARRRGGPNV
jgi:hypothetical protein